MQEPFAHAPSIHPWNAPKYHAQQLRAVTFAKATNQRVLWIAARDWPMATGDEKLTQARIEALRLQFLHLHDKKTAGIMGLFPAVLNLPVRITQTENAEVGAVKNARGILVGWTLPDVEVARLQHLHDQEVVLEQRPTQLLIKLKAATPALKNTYGEGVYCMTPRIRVWSRDNAGYAKVRRIGFALAPEFGGTIHGYCGDTLDAGLLDLLEWHRKPSMDDMHKAYVGKSRTRKAEHTLIVQPYSPHLFRQGELPGPTILMNVLRQEISTEGAQKAWRKAEKAKQGKKDEAPEQKWMRAMPLPCRSCSDESDQSTWNPVTAFTLEDE